MENMTRDTAGTIKSYQAWLAWFDELPQADKLGMQAEHNSVRYRLRQAQSEVEAKAWLKAHGMR
jgi:hypothetical protein